MIYPHNWLGVEVRHLIALEAVLEVGSFAEAARRLGYSQPAVSLQVAQLERIAACRLIDRRPGRRSVTATPAGERVLRHARAMLEQIRATEADLAALAALAAGEAGVVSISTFQSAGARLLPLALRRLSASHPLVEVRLDEGPYSTALERLAGGACDLALVLLPVAGPFESIELLCDPFVYVSADRHAELPSLDELARSPLISWRTGPLMLEAVLAGRGQTPRVILRSDDSATVQRLVGAGLGCAVLPRLALELPDPRLVALDASAHVPARRVGVAWHRDRELSQGARALIGCLRAGIGPD